MSKTLSGITVEKSDPKKVQALGAKQWPIWTKEPSTFDWHYDEKEVCVILEGAVTVKTGDGEISFGGGDLVVFPKGLDCVWNVKKTVRKHYKFG